MDTLFHFILTYLPTGEFRTFETTAMRSEVIHHGLFSCASFKESSEVALPLLSYTDRSLMVRGFEKGDTVVNLPRWQLKVESVNSLRH
ncbi:hypothetical protein GO986_08485 [Deinococcus sp. HMF7620]|uniref:Uncharacterized protein n=1 Tax=Deinococcus arboris TaxID=2682977 RepID=A0A7C9LKM3_9DEIO|nr:hypothetical protein [Deinococcus arboris]MVN86798.1 hypothetical protein [Deinococcus arboris]